MIELNGIYKLKHIKGLNSNTDYEYKVIAINKEKTRNFVPPRKSLYLCSRNPTATYYAVVIHHPIHLPCSRGGGSESQRGKSKVLT